jgi:hypothetical protein
VTNLPSKKQANIDKFFEYPVDKISEYQWKKTGAQHEDSSVSKIRSR